MKLSKINNLKFMHPEVARQWHPGKNGDLTPDQVTPASGKKVWWRCKKNHEWIAAINDRTTGASGCPYCSGRRVNEENNLLAVNPGLAKQWYQRRNKYLKPDQVTPGANKKVWWKCEKGHIWQAKIADRSSGKGCPYCCGSRVSKDYNLQVINPKLSKQWHPDKNGKLTPDKVTPGTKRKAWWKCEKGHEWQATISSRNRGVGCPFCTGKKTLPEKSLAALKPELAKQWHPTKNGTLLPTDVTTGSNKLVWWKCEKGHEWQTVIAHRKYSSICPVCREIKRKKVNSLLVVNPGISREWHPIKNGYLTPLDVTPNSKKKVWWLCENQHEWQAIIKNRNQGTQCPYCYRNKIKAAKLKEKRKEVYLYYSEKNGV